MARWRITFRHDVSSLDVEAEELHRDATTVTLYRYGLVVDRPRRLVVQRVLLSDIRSIRRLDD